MPNTSESHLSRRERQIMDAIYALGEASVSQVIGAMSDPPSYSAVRTLIRILEDKGHLRHRTDKNKYIYAPTKSRQSASRSAIRRLLATFFDGSTEQAMAALLEVSESSLSDADLDRLAKMIEKAKSEGR